MVTGSEVTVADVRAAGVDAVVVATGPVWTRPAVAGAERVCTPPELGAVLAAGAQVPETVAILGGGKPGLTLALAFAARGATVTVVESTAVFGIELGLPGRWRTVADAEAAGVALVAGASVTAVSPTAVEMRADDGTRSIPAASVVSTVRRAGSSALADALRTAGITSHVVGDAAAPRGFEGITRDAEDTARALAG